MIIDTTFNDLLERVVREESDGTFPPSKKSRGLRLINLKTIRKEAGLSTSDIAHFMDVGDSSIRFYERLKYAPRGIERAMRIASILGCSVEDLTTYEELKSYHDPDNVITKNIHSKQSRHKAQKARRSTDDEPVILNDGLKPHYSPSLDDKNTSTRIKQLERTVDDLKKRMENIDTPKESIWRKIFK